MMQTVRVPQLCLLICLAFSSIVQPLALAQTSAPAHLPPAAQEARDKGIIAAKVPDYLLAIRYFEDARKLAGSRSRSLPANSLMRSERNGRARA
jgi:hypothetical protein